MSDETIQNILNVNAAINSRHGVMVVGTPISGKTASIKTFVEVLDKLHRREFGERYISFMLRKASNLGVPVKMVKKDGHEEVVPEE